MESLHGWAPQPLGVQGGSMKQLLLGVEGAPSLHGWGRNWGWELHIQVRPHPFFSVSKRHGKKTSFLGQEDDCGLI